MGLTIHFELGCSGSAGDVKHKLEEVRNQVEDLPIEEVSPLVELDWADESQDTNEALRWLKVQYERDEPIDEHTTKRVPPAEGYGFVIYVGEGCESLNIALTRLHDEEMWSGRAFCKTQYAREFLKCHLLVIAVLDLCKAEGILKSVNDEGGYWETRDINVLAKSINESSALLADFSKFLKNSLPKDLPIKAEIDECQNYVITEDMKRKEKRNNAEKE